MSSLILFLFCLFFHRSHARYLDAHGSSNDRRAYHFGEVSEKMEFTRSISSYYPPKFRPRALSGSCFKPEQPVENGENNLITVNPIEEMDSKSSQKHSSPSGVKEFVVSDEMIDLHGKENKAKGSRREMKESEADEAVDLKENGGEEEEEDVVMMDYAQPHRKPPIHNEKP